MTAPEDIGYKADSTVEEVSLPCRPASEEPQANVFSHQGYPGCSGIWGRGNPLDSADRLSLPESHRPVTMTGYPGLQASHKTPEIFLLFDCQDEPCKQP